VAGLRSYFSLNAQILYWIFVAPLQGKRLFNINEVFRQMVRIGVQAVPMTAMTSFSIGLTLAMQGAYQLAKFGATSFVPDLVGMSLLRELGPLLVGVVVIGRSGSAITAELGTMKVSEEIEALEVMSINPIRYLVVPRFIAMIRLIDSARPIDLYSGMIKSFVFAWLIATIAAKAGLGVTGGAEGVGQSTTSSVVVSIIAMLIANAVMTALFFFASPM